MARVFGDLELQYFQEVLDSGRLGWYHKENSMTTRFEEAFANKVGVRYGITRNSAMTALAQAVSVSEAGVGSEVICDPVVHFGAVATVYMNAVPRFADVHRDTYLMDPASVRANITDKTKALIVTSLWGLCAELDELRQICDEHGIFMIEDCAHNMGSTWKGKHAGSYGDLGCFSFQQGKHLPTGDGGMMTTDREDLYHKLYNEWAFGGESPAFMTLNYRMNELTAALGLAQLSRVDGYVAEYTASLHILNEAIRDCAWLRNRHVPEEAVQSGYIWVCTWEGDKSGLEYDRFKAVAQELGLPLRFGFTGAPAYTFDFFKVSTAYHHTDCPIRCPYYEGDYRYHEGLCPTAEDLIPRLIQSGLIEVPPDEVKKRADLLCQAIEIMERG
jgi:dTDP-4-amino-4,6-dideoxygalactose transaminase